MYLDSNICIPGTGASAALRKRVRRPALLKRLMTAEELAPLFNNDDYIGWSGFTNVGYPKTVPTDRAAVPPSVRLFFVPPFSDTPLTSIPNEPIVFPQDLTYGYYSLRRNHGDPSKPLDWAIVEATAITEEGGIVPGASVGVTP
ncbi:Acetyl-CoA hydrolase [Psilocybe cubensis]|uniref:Acetyl-CoA hydrolase n=2 Tax=Psilocybe cubensis TaxID=181762 RepID=A0ACB8GKU1_PSICU|nr:Acetyl-CoA hydrolase [Psilocybe cubensis]XP_047743710.1 Acetyl-CoA hydrolase [Psilocybe cubensis]KAH9475442.1 Acetyl-CoA hydrolase [Psilocybe cubensis]KAH9476085.1 Acetyl-CoA hydrolase [Psilocybe cubensis]